MANDSSNLKAFVKMRIENWDEILRKVLENFLG